METKIVLKRTQGGLYSKLLIRLKESEKSIKGNSRKDYIPFPVVFEKVCVTFSVKKEEAWEYLFLLREFDFIEVIKFHGIKLNYEVEK